MLKIKDYGELTESDIETVKTEYRHGVPVVLVPKNSTLDEELLRVGAYIVVNEFQYRAYMRVE